MTDVPRTPPGMPSAALTTEQKQKIESWFRQKAGVLGAECPVCHTRNWSTLPDMIAPPPFHGGGMVIGGVSYPHFVLVCTNCGNSQFINAVAAGILDPKGSGA